ncbi:YceH family protein [soil metagenome]
MSAQPDAVEIRVLGSLLEKQRTTPEAYPLSVNALRLACNQSTNRDPVVAYDERTVVAALERLHRRGWTRMASGAGSRARKYRHLIDRALELGEPELAVMCVLMLRGSQTPGELKQRTERMHPFADLAAIEAVLDGLIGRELVARLGRRPGQKEQRYVQLLEGEDPQVGPSLSEETPAAEDDRLARLERELGELRAEVAALREQLGG